MQVIKKKERLTIYIDDIVYGGNGISKYPNEHTQDFVIFVKNAIEGQTVLAEITKLKSNYAEAKIIEVVEKSDLQKNRNYQKISGAPYYDLDIKYQRKKKKQLVIEVFQQLGGINNIEEYYDTFIKSPKTRHYRNKMEYAFSSIIYDKEKKCDIDDFGLGFKKANTWWMVENLEKDSGLFDKQWEDSLSEIRAFCIETGLPAWNIPQKKGFFRNLNVRKSYKNDQLLIELVTSSHNIKKFETQLFVKKIIELHNNKISGIIHTVNDDVSDRINYKNVDSKTIFGDDKIIENMLGLDFEIYMSSFFQTNPLCAQKLYETVVEYTSLNSHIEKPVILDLFCGTGTIAQMIATKKNNSTVIGVDIASSSIQNAKKSAEKNNIKNVQFHNLDIGDFLIQNQQLKGKINSIIIDPPRPGVSKKSIKKIIELNGEEIIYVSCNPSTQARDIKLLLEYGYIIKKFSIADQFPHTHHIETIFLLVKSIDNVS